MQGKRGETPGGAGLLEVWAASVTAVGGREQQCDRKAGWSLVRMEQSG